MFYWSYYKSTIVINLCVSVAIVLIAYLLYGDVSFYLFAASIAFIGPPFVFLYKEIVRPLEYFFYYNRAITKIKLISFCLTVNILLATIISIIVYYVTSA